VTPRSRTTTPRYIALPGFIYSSTFEPVLINWEPLPTVDDLRHVAVIVAYMFRALAASSTLSEVPDIR
jgi:hypothetical protein